MRGDRRRLPAGARLRAGARPLTLPETRVVEGGATRSESVANALEAVETELVAIHDAARPLLTPELIDGRRRDPGGRPRRGRRDRRRPGHRHDQAGRRRDDERCVDPS